MNKVILATLFNNEETGTPWSDLYYSWQDLHTATFNPCIEPLFITDFKIHGKTYNERKENARQLAIDYSNIAMGELSGLSWSELITIQDKFEKIGRKYGLLQEFRENGIC